MGQYGTAQRGTAQSNTTLRGAVRSLCSSASGRLVPKWLPSHSPSPSLPSSNRVVGSAVMDWSVGPATARVRSHPISIRDHDEVREEQMQEQRNRQQQHGISNSNSSSSNNAGRPHQQQQQRRFFNFPSDSQQQEHAQTGTGVLLSSDFSHRLTLGEPAGRAVSRNGPSPFGIGHALHSTSLPGAPILASKSRNEFGEDAADRCVLFCFVFLFFAISLCGCGCGCGCVCYPSFSKEDRTVLCGCCRGLLFNTIVVD